MWETARRQAGLMWVRVAMVVRYEHASDERASQLAQELNRYTEGANLIPLGQCPQPFRARSADDEGEAEDEVALTPSLNSKNEEKCSGGETRTLNLAEGEDEAS